MNKQSRCFLISHTDLTAANIRLSKYSSEIASSVVSMMMSFVFETAIILKILCQLKMYDKM